MSCRFREAGSRRVLSIHPSPREVLIPGEVTPYYCELANRDGEIWYRSTRDFLAAEELYTKYSHDNSYWNLQFSTEQLQSLRQALLTASNYPTFSEAQRIIRNFSFTCKV